MPAKTRRLAPEAVLESPTPSVRDVLTASPIKVDWHSGLSIYASEAFLKTVGDEYGWLGGIDGTGKLRCVLPYTIVKKAFFRMVRFRVETIAIGGELNISEEKAFLTSVVTYFRGIGADMIIPASTNTVFRTHPDGAIAAPYGSYVVDLLQSEQVLWTNLHSKHRNVIRNATKNGVQIRTGRNFEETIFNTIKATLERSSLGFMSRDAFRRFVLNCGENVKLFVAEYEGVVQGCAVIPFSGHSAYYVYGGSVPQPQTGAMNLLHWEAIRHFRERGVKNYDFVGVRINPEKGSKQEGLMMFKERFGGRLAQGYMWKFSLNALKYLAYNFAVRLVRGGDIVDQEHCKLGIQTEKEYKMVNCAKPVEPEQNRKGYGG